MSNDLPLSIERLRSTNLYLAYRRGWTNGASGGLSVIRKDDAEAIKAAYRMGHADGARSRKSAIEYAAKRFGHDDQGTKR